MYVKGKELCDHLDGITPRKLLNKCGLFEAHLQPR